MDNPDDLTPRQQSVLAFITDFQREFAIAPTVREIAAVLVQDLLTEATLKIVRRKGNVLTLEPANRRYKVLSFKGVERRRVAIIGKLAGIVRRS